MMVREDVSIWTIASLVKYLKAYNFGIPIIIEQQMVEKEDRTRDRLEAIFDGPNFRNIGTKNEIYGTIGVRLVVCTTMCATDIYYHQRVKSKAIEALSHTITLYRTGTKNSDKAIVGTIKPIDTVTVNPISSVEPDASIVEAMFTINLC